MTRDEARTAGLMGWNLRCNRCGTYGANWHFSERPGWGALALCPKHGQELAAEYERHRRALDALRAVHYEQELATRPTQEQER